MTPRTAFAALIVGALTLLGGCAAFGPPPLVKGQSEADVARVMGAPTGRYAMPGGGTRLEYATGPAGRTTWMVDLDGSGKVTSFHQALDEPRLHAFQQRAPGLTKDELLRTLGRPGEMRVAGWQGGQLWSYRFITNECLWYQVELSDAGIVRSAGFGLDWSCDARTSDRGQS